MDIQLIIAILLFAVAVFFIGRRFYKQIFKKNLPAVPIAK
jgi:hypothetical protein